MPASGSSFWCGSVFVACLLSLPVTGCGRGEGPHPVPVSGTVTWNGKPLSSGTITFLPTGATAGRMASGGIDERGQYELSSIEPGDGIVPGDYMITVNVVKIIKAPDLSPNASPLDAIGRSERVLPDKYYNAQQSGLTATIDESDSRKTIDFTLEGRR